MFLRTAGSLATSSSFSVGCSFQLLLAQVLDVPFLFQFLAAGAEAEHEITLELAGLGEGGDLVSGRSKSLKTPPVKLYTLGAGLPLNWAIWAAILKFDPLRS